MHPDCFFIDKPAVLCHTLASEKKTVLPIPRQCRIVLMADPLMLQPAAVCCFQHVDIFRSACAAMLKVQIFDGNIPLIEPLQQATSSRLTVETRRKIFEINQPT